MLEVFKSKEYVQANALYRWLDERVFDKYYDCILAHADRTPKVILDVGCGTGQFAINYANKEPECQVYALDYSSEQIEIMMEIAKLHGIRNLVPVLSSVEDYVPDLEFDVIICSEMIHLIDDLLLFSKKLTSMLKIGGIIAVRTPSAAHIYERKYYDYFPTCRYIDLLRCKSKELIETSFSLNGTFIFESYEFDESRIIRTADLIRGTKMKLYSTLHLISQKEFSYGLQRMVQDFSGSDIYSQNFKMMLYLLKKGDCNGEKS